MSLSVSARRPLSSRCGSAPCRTTCAAHKRACAGSPPSSQSARARARRAPSSCTSARGESEPRRLAPAPGAKARSAASARSTSACLGKGASCAREASRANSVHASAIPALNRRRAFVVDSLVSRVVANDDDLVFFRLGASDSASRRARTKTGAAKHFRTVSSHNAMPPGRSRSKARVASFCAFFAAASSASAFFSAAFLFLCVSAASPRFLAEDEKKEAPNVDVFVVDRPPPLAFPSPDDDAPSPPFRSAAEVCLAASSRRSSGVLTRRRAAASFPRAAAAAAAASSSSWSSSENSVDATASPRERLADSPAGVSAGSVHRSKPPGEVASAPSATHAAATAPASAPRRSAREEKNASNLTAARRSLAAATRVSGRRGRADRRVSFPAGDSSSYDEDDTYVEETIAPTVLSAARRTARAPFGDPSAAAARSGARRRSRSAAATTPPAAPRMASTCPLFASLVNASSAPILLAARDERCPKTKRTFSFDARAIDRPEAFLSSSANATATSSLTHEYRATSFPTKNRFARTFAAVTRTAGPAHPPHVTRSITSSSDLCASFTSADELRSVVAAVSARSSNNDR